MNNELTDKHGIAKAWIALFDELENWQAAGKRARLWWRDDDAQKVTWPLERLVELSELHHIPLLLAVIPRGVDPALADHVGASGAPITIAQHGIAHQNNAPPDSKKTELHDDMLRREGFETELLAGRDRLADLFGSSFLAAMVPPWNRIGPLIAGRLAAWNYIGLSADGPPRPAARDIPQVNTHLDLIDWRSGKKFIGPELAVGGLTDLLVSRRHAGDGADGQVEPIGILTHHLDHERPLWTFLSQLFGLLGGHPAVHWADAKDLFAPR